MRGELQPLARYELDAAILFSDILTVPDAMGLGLYFVEGEGPKFERPLREEWEIRNLAAPDPGVELRYVMDAVAEIRRALDNSVPLIGFSGSPFTLACYMIEGGASEDFRTIKAMLYDRPELLHHVLDVNASAVTAYLNAQIEAGAQAVMIFDLGWALSHRAYREFHGLRNASFQPEAERRRTHPKHRTSRTEGIGWRSRPSAAMPLRLTPTSRGAPRVGDKVALQQPRSVALFAQPEKIAQEARHPRRLRSVAVTSSTRHGISNSRRRSMSRW